MRGSRSPRARSVSEVPVSIFVKGVTDDPTRSDRARQMEAADPAAPSLPNAVSLRLIATTDLHASLLPYDYHANRPVEGRSHLPGFDRVSLIARCSAVRATPLSFASCSIR